VHDTQTCPTCHTTPLLLPRLTKDTVEAAIENQPILVQTAQQTTFLQPMDSVLILNFDSYLAITDFRASLYLSTLIRHVREQAETVHLSTNHPDTWTRLTEADSNTAYQNALSIRQEHNLPPYSLLIRFSAAQPDILNKLLPLTFADIISVGKIHRAHNLAVLTLLLKSNSHLPNEWSQNRVIKLDILPLYIH
jgi:hypothetical protein